MDFIDTLKKLTGAYVFLGLVDLATVSGVVKSIDNNHEIMLEIDDSEIVNRKVSKTAVDRVEYVLILNPANN